MSYPVRPLSYALTRVERKVQVQPATIYKMLGVRSFGRGAFAPDDLLGIDTSYHRFLQVATGDIVYPKLMAWEGAFALVQEVHDKRHVSTEFCTFEAKPTADPRFIAYALRTPWIVQAVAGSSGGTNVRRRRLYPDDFLTKEIPLPDLGEQRRIADHLDGVTRLIAALNDATSDASRDYWSLAEAAVQTLLDDGARSNWDLVPLGVVADINPRRSKIAGDETVAFVPMASVDGVTGRIVSPDQRLAVDIKSGYKQFLRGDVIFARITPCMQNGKSAVATDDLPAVGFGSSEFHVIRPTNRVLPEWIHAIVRSRNFRNAAAGHFTGTAGQQRVPARFLEEVKVPIPPSTIAQREALASIDGLLRCAMELRRLSERRQALVGAMSASVLNRAFAGLA